MSYQLELDSDVRRTLRKLTRADPQAAARITKALDLLTEESRPKGVKALAGASGLLRVRVGHYRIVYTVEDGRLVVLVLRVGHLGPARAVILRFPEDGTKVSLGLLDDTTSPVGTADGGSWPAVNS